MDEGVAPVPSAAYHYLHDVLGSVIGLVNDAGELVERYTYDPYGKVFIETWDATANGGAGAWLASAEPTSGLPVSSVGNPFMWTGHRYDAAVGLYATLYRTYSPTLGRWLQRDPIEYEGGSINLYEYVLSAPNSWVDPLGLFFTDGSNRGTIPVVTRPYPPIPVPGSPETPWKWVSEPGNSRGGKWVPETPVKTQPRQGQPDASREPGEGKKPPHWDVNDGKGHRRRYNDQGEEISVEEAHGRDPKNCPKNKVTPEMILIITTKVVTDTVIDTTKEVVQRVENAYENTTNAIKSAIRRATAPTLPIAPIPPRRIIIPVFF